MSTEVALSTRANVQVDPASWGPVRRVTRAVAAAWLALVGYLGALVLAALVEGHSATYPFRAIAALFVGDRVLPGQSHLGNGFHGGDAVKLAVWLLFLGLLVGVAFAAVQPARLRATTSGIVLLAIVWSLVFWVIGVVLMGLPVKPHVQRVSSYEGVRELGAIAFLFAHLVYGALLGWLYRVLPVRQR